MLIDRRFPTATLAIQVAVAGTLVMVLEIAGSRVLTPVYGGSITTWGGLIGVVLSCLSFGYYIGGWLADRTRPRLLLTNALLLSALYTLAIPSLSGLVLRPLDPLNVDERLGIVLSSLAILGPPTFLLGAVSPIAVKILTKELARLGRSAGNLYALSTFGSIVGTFLTTFVLVPMMEITSIFYFSGLTLLIASSLSLQNKKVLIIPIMFAIAFHPSGITFYLTCASSLVGEVRLQSESLYNQIIVLDRGGTRYLYLNGLVHSAMDLSDPYELVFPYTRLFVAGVLLKPNASSSLFIGGGGFSGPKFFLKNYPYMRVDVVEIDPEVVEVAETFFEVELDPRLGVYVEDGRRYLSRVDEVYDVIILDAYSKNYIPFHMLTLEFLMLLKSRLERDGVVVSNIIASITGPTSDILRAAYKTYKAVFRNVLLIPVSSTNPLQVQNVILIASDSDEVSRENLIRLAGEDAIAKELGLDLLVKNALTDEPMLRDVPLLTDDYSPVENMLNPVTGSKFGSAYYLGVVGPSICG